MIHPSRHAIRRYRERCRPELSVKEAAVELAEKLAAARVSAHEPRWFRGTAPEMFAHLTKNCALPLYRTATGWIAVTCLTKEGQRFQPRGRTPQERRADVRRELREIAREANAA